MKYNIYCDESCHLENDKQNFMVLGGIICIKNARNIVKRDILEIKKKNNINANTEIKWNKVSPSKINYYKDLIDYFFDNEDLRFRALIIDKRQLKHEFFNQTHDEWYYKMYYQLLQNLVEPKGENYIYLDIKDTKSAKKVEGLKKFLNFKMNEYDIEPIKHIQSINSLESVIMQLSDLLIGAIGFKNREMYNSKGASMAKVQLMTYIIEKSGYSLNKSTFLSEKKFNIFCINLKVGDFIG